MKKRLQELDALRGIAALLVVGFHYTMHRDISSYGWELGVTGVDLFFIISGFVIFMSAQKIDRPFDFIRRRFFRLFPVYWVIVTFTWVLMYLNVNNNPLLVDVPPSRYFVNLTMLQRYFDIPSLDGSYWTMLVEMQFYFLVAIAMWIKKLNYLIVTLMVLMSLVLINELIIQPISPEMFTWLFRKSEIWIQIINRLPFFVAGMLFYKIYIGEGRWRTVIAILMCYITALLIFDNIEPSKYFIDVLQYVLTTTIYFGVFILFVRNRLKLIVNPVTLFLGKVSYSLYLIHQFLGIHLIIPYLETECGIDYRLGVIISALVAILLAFFVNRFIEEPSMRLYRKRKTT